MTTDTIDSTNFVIAHTGISVRTADELIMALEELAGEAGRSLDEIALLSDRVRMSLIERALPDGSIVHEISIRGAV